MRLHTDGHGHAPILKRAHIHSTTHTHPTNTHLTRHTKTFIHTQQHERIHTHTHRHTRQTHAHNRRDTDASTRQRTHTHTHTHTRDNKHTHTPLRHTDTNTLVLACRRQGRRPPGARTGPRSWKGSSPPPPQREAMWGTNPREPSPFLCAGGLRCLEEEEKEVG